MPKQEVLCWCHLWGLSGNTAAGVNLTQSPARSKRASQVQCSSTRQENKLLFCPSFKLPFGISMYYSPIIWTECPNKTPGTWGTWSLLLKLSHFDQNVYALGQMLGVWLYPTGQNRISLFFLLKLISVVDEQESAISTFTLFTLG